MACALGRVPHEQRTATIEVYGREVIPRVPSLLAAGPYDGDACDATSVDAHVYWRALSPEARVPAAARMPRRPLVSIRAVGSGGPGGRFVGSVAVRRLDTHSAGEQVVEHVPFLDAQGAEQVVLDQAEPSVGETEFVLALR